MRIEVFFARILSKVTWPGQDIMIWHTDLYKIICVTSQNVRKVLKKERGSLIGKRRKQSFNKQIGKHYFVMSAQINQFMWSAWFWGTAMYIAKTLRH